MALRSIMKSLAIQFQTGAFVAKTFECPAQDASDAVVAPPATKNSFEKLLNDEIISKSPVLLLKNDFSMEFYFNISIVGERDDLAAMQSASKQQPTEIASIGNSYEVIKITNSTMKPLRTFYRIGVAEVSLIAYWVIRIRFMVDSVTFFFFIYRDCLGRTLKEIRKHWNRFWMWMATWSGKDIALILFKNYRKRWISITFWCRLRAVALVNASPILNGMV